ncbi:imidazole glycerol phosphate synthase subunit HisF [Candidatus Berkiella cookevillensis]|uniref:imidazole glycerol-phosphate synthase n=1 Tax=Candidatus Berkiella cookevillensis TaxID=437022 RepID=A0A0Q9YNH8_9GAMM|nr:imidazole glycerol phosphate synthase subunit HisF [Candidatus Berkiella cookevillensis]MCS5708113.1 imidazole glycerol phosphate synthase subunit HisF [Candidatus Berkiella cookevillensis]
MSNLAKRIIPCLDVKEEKVVKGIRFRNHRIVGDIVELAQFYVDQGADELVFYDISASAQGKTVDKKWVKRVAQIVNIPFCVAGGIRSVQAAEYVLNQGADKISVNSPALENPSLINELVTAFGSQCIVVGIDSMQIDNDYRVCQYTGSEKKTQITQRLTKDWVREVQERGAGEIVLNTMDQDGCKKGYDIKQLQLIRSYTHVPLIASGGAGTESDFLDVFRQAKVNGALAASVFHERQMSIGALKNYLVDQGLIFRI